MVSDQYHVNVMLEDPTIKKQLSDIKGSISSPIPAEDVTSVLEYFGINPSDCGHKMDNPYKIQNHSRGVNIKNGHSRHKD